MNAGSVLPAMICFVMAEINFSSVVSIIFTEEYVMDLNFYKVDKR